MDIFVFILKYVSEYTLLEQSSSYQTLKANILAFYMTSKKELHKNKNIHVTDRTPLIVLFRKISVRLIN